MTKRRLIIIGGIVAIPVVALALWLGAPLVIDDTVDEEFPMAANAEVPDDMTAEEVEAEMEDAAEAAPTEVDEDMPEEAGEEAQVAGEEAQEAGSASAPTALLSGEFTGADEFHQGEGLATIYELEDGSRVLRFEEFEVTNGPDLHVFLIPEEGGMDGYIDLGSLKGNVGNQNYEIPEDVDILGIGEVIIYCVPFSVLFASAPLG